MTCPMSTPVPSNIRACPICDKMVNVTRENHTLWDCRNFLLAQYYQQPNPARRRFIGERVERLNERLGLRGKNLLDI